ncbi:MAG: 6-phosphofructokinase [Desulfuromonadales bacterium]|nr:6-phosphofructokinase [Desulfuromonadales bacterium]
MKKIAILTSGGDCSGMNATIRAVVRTAIATGMEVVGIQKGFAGMVNNWMQPLTVRSVSGIVQRGGTMLKSARCPEMHELDTQKKVVETLKRAGIEGVILLGGDGSLRGAYALHQLGVRIMAIPASIDNDIAYTDMSLGVDTALNNIRYAVDALKDTASSHDRAFVVETMGRNCGYLAVVSAIACGAEFALIPETPFDLDSICIALRKRFNEGRDNSIIMVAEGAGKAEKIAADIKDRIGFETRVMVLGHYQRGGSPTTFDRLLGARFGVAAFERLVAGNSGEMVGLSCGGLAFTQLHELQNAGRKQIDAVVLKLARLLVN